MKTHVAHLLTRLGLRDRLQIVIFAYDNGGARPALTGAAGITSAGPASA